MKPIRIILVFAFVFGTLESKAQNAWEFDYQLSFPTGKFRDFTADPGWLGLSGQWRRYASNKQLSYGAAFSWFYFADKQGRQTRDFGENGTYTGFLTNFTNIYGLSGIVQYDFKRRSEKTVPFARLGLGAAYQNQRTDIGLFAFQADGIQFMTHIETGLRFNELLGHSALVLAATYHLLPASGDLVPTQFVGIKIGIESFNW
jgi:hypothetical protein